MSSSRRSCVNDPNMFCYICGEYTVKKFRKPITDFIKSAYFSYFNSQIEDKNKPWIPQIVCKMCYEHLRQWVSGKRSRMRFGVPMQWREPKNHFDDCYFCCVNLHGVNVKKMIYPDLQSARRPLPHSEEVPVPTFCFTYESSCEETDSNASSDSDIEETASSEPKPFTQVELNDLIRDLELPKESAELLASRLKEKNLLASGTKVTFYRTREQDLLPFFNSENDLVFCSDVQGLLLKMGLSKYQPSEWRLFIDSSKRSLKCVLLHNGNQFGSVPIAHSTKLKEEYQNIALVLGKIKYNEHKWSICVDLKMVNFLLGQQSGYTKYPCFYCLWDSRAKQQHWRNRDWPVREMLEVGKQNVINPSLVPRDKIILPPLHIKLGLMKQFVKALDKNGQCFSYITRKFRSLSIEKIKAGIFDGPQIRILINDTNFSSSMTSLELLAWNSFVEVTKNFLGNHKSSNYSEIVNNMLENFKNLGCNMSVKVHYLHSHLDQFPENLGSYSEEQGERFHQDLKTMEERYKGRWDQHNNMMADYC